VKFITTNLNLYKIFLAVFETRNYSAAGAELELSQPTVSYNIKELERTLGTRLFRTSSREVRPTDNAAILYAAVKDGFGKIAEAEKRISQAPKAAADQEREITTAVDFTKNFDISVNDGGITIPYRKG
jgi:DNA-binding transcriptional LysR family regulator